MRNANFRLQEILVGSYEREQNVEFKSIEYRLQEINGTVPYAYHVFNNFCIHPDSTSRNDRN